MGELQGIKGQRKAKALHQERSTRHLARGPTEL
jgi:hypothetical protein